MVSTEQIQELRAETGAGMMDVKKALDEAQGDAEKAREILRKKGADIAAKKSGRATKAGLVISYIHGEGRIGVLLKIFCETDFVARTDDFKNFANDIAMHIAAMDPQYLNLEDIPSDVIETERRIYREQFADSGKSDEVVDKIVEGKLSKYAETVSLLEQAFVKDPDIKIKDLVEKNIAKMGENIQIGEFARFEL